jgi:hypothetical protein
MKKLFLVLLTLLSLASYGQILLTNTTYTLEATTSSTSGIDYRVVYFDETSSGAGLSTASVGKITTATTTTILSAPGSSTTRTINSITLANRGSADNTITVKIDVSGTEYNETPAYTIKAGESLYYNDLLGWYTSNALTSTVSGVSVPFGKTGTASDAAAYWYGYWKDTGVLGAWAPGSPGLAGRATDGTDAANDAGCIYFTDAGAGKARYLTEVCLDATIASSYSLWDVLWVNSGLSVTTTTGQTINSVTLPARDLNGSTNGEGVYIGIYAVAALGNAGVVSNSTVTYTNSAGTGSRTATLSATVPQNFPATPVIGTVVWFDLQAGDTGVRSIQTVTLNTTLTSGTASVFMARKLVDIPVSVVNTTFCRQINNGLGVRLYDNSCILPFARTSATTATVINGSVTTDER